MRVRTLVALLLFTLYPAAAHAWWWDYFDGLTGPGPFTASYPTGVEFRIWTVDDESKKTRLLADSQELKWFVVARWVGMDNDSEVDHLKENFKNPAGEAVRVSLNTFDVAVMRRLLPAPALDFGVGLSLLRASGDTFDTRYRVGPIAKLTFSPVITIWAEGSWLRLLGRVPKLYGDFVVFRGFKGADFGNTAVNLPDVEGKFRAGILLDVTPLLCGATSGAARCR